MKSLLIGLLALTPFLADAQVEFSGEKDWNKILSEAKSADKLVFVDAYTDWCGWCKVMDKKTFPDTTLGDFMNARFINVKLEMEQDEWGVKLAKKYGVFSFPTFLIFRPDGTLLGFTGGYQPATDFIRSLETALTNRDIKRPGYSASFEVDYPEFYDQVFARDEDGESAYPTDSTLNSWMDLHRNDLGKEEVFQPFLRFRYKLSAENLAGYYSSRALIAEQFGEDVQEELENEILYLEVMARLKADSTTDLKAFIEKRKSRLDLDEGKVVNIWIFYYQEKEDWVAMGQNMDLKFQSDGITSAFWWNQQSWKLYEECEDQETLKLAAKWLKAVCQEETDWAYWDTYAALLYKTGQYEEAQSAAKEAIRLGKEKEANIAATERLLEKIEEKLD